AARAARHLGAGSDALRRAEPFGAARRLLARAASPRRNEWQQPGTQSMNRSSSRSVPARRLRLTSALVLATTFVGVGCSSPTAPATQEVPGPPLAVKPRQSLCGEGNAPLSGPLALSADGALVGACDREGRVLLFDAKTGQRLCGSPLIVASAVGLA